MSTVDPSGPDALTRRIEELAAFDVDEGDGVAVGVLVSAVRTEIGSVRAELSSVRAEVGAVRTELDGLAGRLTGSVAASRSETGTLVKRVAELGARIDGVGTRVDDVRNGLPGLSREVRETLQQVPNRGELEASSGALREALEARLDTVSADVHRSVTAALEQEAQATEGTQAALVDARGALESRLAVLEDTLDAMSERLESLARDGASTTTDRLTQLAAGVAALERRIEEQGSSAAELLVGRLRDVTETRMGELENTLYDRLSMILRARTEELRDDVVTALERTNSESAEARTAVGELAETVSRALDGFGTALDRSLTGLGGSVSQALAEGREQTRGDLGTLAERLAGSVGSLQADLGRRADAGEQLAAGLRSSVEERLEALRSQVVAALSDARADVATEVGTVRPQVAELIASSAATGEAFAAMRSDLAQSTEGLRERLTAVSAEQTTTVRDALAETRAEVAERTRALREEVLERVEQVFSAVVERLGEMAADVTGGTAATRGATERLASLVAASDDVRRTLDGVRTDVATSTEAMRAALVASAEEQFTALQDRVVEVRGVVDGSAGDTRELQERVAALAEATAAFRTELESTLDVVRDDVVEAGRDLRKELVTKTSASAAAMLERLGELTGIVDTAQTAVQGSTATVEQLSEDVGALVETTDVLGGIVGGFRKEWPTRTLEVVQGAKAISEATVGQVRQEVGAKLDDVAAQLARALGGVDTARKGIDTGTKRLSAAGQVLVSYLAERDRILEAERDRVLHEVLDQFAAGLSARDRSVLSGRMGDAVARRRDSRDAERYRAAVGEPTPPVLELPDDVEALVPPPPAPPAPAPTPAPAPAPAAAAPPSAPVGRLGAAVRELAGDDAALEADDEVPTRAASRPDRARTTDPAAGGATSDVGAADGRPPAAKAGAAKKAAPRPSAKKASATKAAAKKAPATKKATSARKAAPARKAPSKQAAAEDAPAATAGPAAQAGSSGPKKAPPPRRRPPARRPAPPTSVGPTEAPRTTPVRGRVAPRPEPRRVPVVAPQPARPAAAPPPAARDDGERPRDDRAETSWGSRPAAPPATPGRPEHAADDRRLFGRRRR